MNLYESLTLNPFLSRLCRPELTTWLSRQLLANPIASYRPGSTRRLFNRFRGFLTGPGVIWPALRPSDRRWGLLTGREDFWPALMLSDWPWCLLTVYEAFPEDFWPALRNSDRSWGLLTGPEYFWPALRPSDRPWWLLTGPEAFWPTLMPSHRPSVILTGFQRCLTKPVHASTCTVVAGFSLAIGPKSRTSTVGVGEYSVELGNIFAGNKQRW